MIRKPDAGKGKMLKLNLCTVAIIAGILAWVVLPSPGCKGAGEVGAPAQSVKITAEPVNGSGLLVMIEYYRGSELVNSVRLIDGDGDGIIDGKSGPTVKGQWPKGWSWFDELYDDVAVGHSTIAVTEGKIKILDGTAHEFRTGDYEAEGTGSKAEDRAP